MAIKKGDAYTAAAFFTVFNGPYAALGFLEIRDITAPTTQVIPIMINAIL